MVKGLTAAVTALNAAVMANPYTAAIVLIVGIATAMWYFYDGTTAAEKALKSFNDEQDKLRRNRKRLVRLLIRTYPLCKMRRRQPLQKNLHTRD